MTQVARINLSGDFMIPKEDGKTVVGNTSTDPNLEALDAFLASLRNSVNSNDQFSNFVSLIAERLKLPTGNVVLSIESSITDGVLRHDFSFRSEK